MSRQLLVALTVALSLNVVLGAVLKTVHAGDDGQYQIIDGNCNNALAGDMIFHDHVHKTRLPLLERDAESSWHGDQTIYCLKVLNEKDASKGSTALVKEGGVGHTFVTIDMHSSKNHGLEFTIQVFAK